MFHFSDLYLMYIISGNLILPNNFYGKEFTDDISACADAEKAKDNFDNRCTYSLKNRIEIHKLHLDFSIH